MKQSDPQFKLRLPADLKAELEAAAEAQGKTLTAVIVDQLQSAEKLRKDVETLGLYVQDRDRTARLLEAMMEMLARFFITMHAELPAKVRADENLQAPLHFARALVAKRKGGVSDAFADLFATKDPRLAQPIQRLRDELERAPPIEGADSGPSVVIAQPPHKASRAGRAGGVGAKRKR